MECAELNLSDGQSVRGFAARYSNLPGGLQLLVNNAGIFGAREPQPGELPPGEPYAYVHLCMPWLLGRTPLAAW